ncbi:hypothetical protein GCM10010407_16160 [Rarobacter incanus]
MAGISTPIAQAAPATGGTFSTSFEASEAQPLTGTAYGALTNVTGKKFSAGSLLGLVSAVTASGENLPNEGAAKAADGVSSTKWLVKTNTGWLQYQLSSPAVVKQYKMTTADDSPARNPKSWKVQGSTDGSSWDTLDTRADQLPTSTPKLTTFTYNIDNNTAYSYYRLAIDANNGDSMIQLGDWEILDGTSNAASPSPIQTTVSTGPVSAKVARVNAGFTGKASMQYVGAHIAAGEAKGAGVLFDDQNIAIGDSSQLSYAIFPILDETDLTYPATYTALDLVLDDNTLVSSKGLVDTNGFDFKASAYGEQKALYGSQWNKVTVDLGSLAGRTIKKILISYDNPNGSATTAFAGWVDDIKIADATARDTSAGLVSYVDTRRGTNSNDKFSRGNNLPITAMPNGFNFFTPMTDASSSRWEYSYQNSTYVDSTTGANKLNGFGISHEPSPWMGDRNQVVFMPDTAGTGGSGNLSSRAKTYSHDTEIARPDYYSVMLDGGNLRTEISPTDHGAIIRYTNNKSGDTTLRSLIDIVGGQGSFTVDAAGAVTGWVDPNGGSGATRMFIAGKYSSAPSATTAGTDRTASKISVVQLDGNKQVELRIATSFISQDQAQLNLDREVTGKTFDQIRQAAGAAWNARLGVIDLADSNATDAQKVTTYSNLYRLNLYPNSQFEDVSQLGSNTPEYKHASPVLATTGSATATTTNAQIKDGKIYVNNGFWDTYRTVWPLYSFLYPDIAEELVDGFVQQYREGGWVARWSSPGYADSMTGTSSDASFAEAYTSGAIDTATALEAYDAGLKNATVVSPQSQTGRKGLNTSQFVGYTSTATSESVSWALEGYINDNALADMAAKLATDTAVPQARRAQIAQEATYLRQRAKNYVNMFDSTAGFFQGKTSSGAFATASASFDPEVWGGVFTETNGWNFAFHAPFDVEGLAALYGGQQGLIDKLDAFFTTQEKADKPGGYGGVIHEMLEARDVRMGEFGMSNQVSHHIPWIYAAAGKPSKTQAAVREVMQRLFVGSEIGQGYPGDEDNGEMSSWQIFASLGFYPLSLGSGEFTIGSPLYDHVVVHRENGDLTIDANANSRDNVYIASATLDGESLGTASLSQAALNAAGDHTLSFEMSATPTTWGERTFTAQSAQPLVDVTGPDYATVQASDGTATDKLVDNSSTTSIALNSATASLTFASKAVAASVQSYTLTNASSGAAPKAWKLQGSNDGTTWKTLDSRSDQEFRWATQTRPFQVEDPGTYSSYRIVIEATSTGEPATIAEVELLAGQVQKDELTVIPTTLTTQVGSAVTAGYALIAGGSSAASGDYSATVDFLDGNGPQSATVTSSGLGLTVSLAHTFSATGVYSLPISVTQGGETATGTATVTVSRDQTMQAQFNNACITVLGVAADCDGNTNGYKKESLAASGFVQGTTVQVPGKGVSFDLPDIASGKPDNLVSTSAPVRINVGDDATKVSFIGFANEKDQTRTLTLTYGDGHTQDIVVGFDNWDDTGSKIANTSNVVVGSSEGRYKGTSTSETSPTFYVWSTDTVTLDTGHGSPLWLTMSAKPDTSKAQLHLFAVASDGTRTAPAALTAEPSAEPVSAAYAGSATTVDLAEFAGGDTASNAYSATINWGDDSPVTGGQVADGKVAGTHVFAKAGTYTVTVSIDDGVHTVVTSRQVTVSAKVDSTVTVAGPATNPTTTTTASITATVPNDATGTVEFFDGPTSLGTATVSNGKATLAAGPLAAGTHSVTAKYAGDAKYNGSTSAPAVVTVDKADATVVVNSTPGSPLVGSTFTLQATVSTGATGTVEFFDGSTSLGTATVSGGVASISVTAPATSASKEYKATYSGDATYKGATTTVSIAITSVAATVSLTASAATATPVSGPTLTATLTAGATGTVEFFAGSDSLGKVQISNDKATLPLSGLPVGSHVIKAVYSGDSALGGADSNTVTIISELAASSVEITTSATDATVLETVTLTANLTGPSTGTVEFYDADTKIGSASATSGVASFEAGPGLSVGEHSFSARFVENESYRGATSPAKVVTVDKAASATELSAAPTTTDTLGTVVLTATVTDGATGSVEFFDGDSLLGSQAIDEDTATAALNVTGLAAGKRMLTAVYAGDATYKASTSDAVEVQVSKVAATLSLASDVEGRAAIAESHLTATVPAGATGDVEFFDGSESLGTASIVNGTANLTVGALTAGDHSFTAKFAGDERFGAAESDAVAVAVVASTTSVTLTSSASAITTAGSLDLTATLADNATGTVEFFDGTRSLGTAAIAGGAATIKQAGLSAGAHSFTAKYSGDQYYAPASSQPAAVEVTQAPDGAAKVTLGKPQFTKSSQLYKSTKPASVSVTVRGAQTGSVTFKAGSKIVGVAPIVGGKATVKLSTKLWVGKYKVVASMDQTDTTAAAVSTASSTFTVKKSSIKKIKVQGKRYTPGRSFRVTVKASKKLNSGRIAGGKVKVYVGKKVVKTIKTPALRKRNGKYTVTVPARFAKGSSLKVRAKFVPKYKGASKAKTSKTIKLKATR